MPPIEKHPGTFYALRGSGEHDGYSSDRSLTEWRISSDSGSADEFSVFAAKDRPKGAVAKAALTLVSQFGMRHEDVLFKNQISARSFRIQGRE